MQSYKTVDMDTLLHLRSSFKTDHIYIALQISSLLDTKLSLLLNTIKNVLKISTYIHHIHRYLF